MSDTALVVMARYPEVDLTLDLEDRFGELPLSVRNLLEYARLRILGRARGVTVIERTLHSRR